MPRQRIDAIGGVGYNVDANPAELPPPALQKMRNVICRDGMLWQAPGETSAIGPGTGILGGVDPLYHTTYRDAAGKWWAIWSDGTRVTAYLIDGSETVVTLASGWVAGRVSFADLNGVLVVNSATEGPWYLPALDGGGLLQPLETLPEWDLSWTCEIMTGYRYNLVAINMTEGVSHYTHKVRWSNSAQEGTLPTIWVAAPENDAGADLIGETAGIPYAAVGVRDSLWIIKDDSIYAMRWIGGQFVMQLSKLMDDVGTALPFAAVEMRGGAVIFTGQDVLLVDGQQAKSITNSRIRKTIEDNLSRSQAGWAKLCHYPPGNLILLTIPQQAEAFTSQITLIWDYKADTWSSHDDAYVYGYGVGTVSVLSGQETWDGDTITWDGESGRRWALGLYTFAGEDLIVFKRETLFGEPNKVNVCFKDGSTTYANTRPVVSSAQRTGIPLEGADGIATVTEVWPEIKTGSCYLYFGGHDVIDSVPSIWDGPYLIESGGYFPVTPRVFGRYFAFRIEGTGYVARDSGGSESYFPGDQFALASLTINWERDGEA